ncbi:MAG: hypothetical protein MUC85_03190 [Anaerolineales bacterium]|nr:hypothetical protein [Anaerolineales bacterium]
MKMSVMARILLLLTGLLAAYMVAVGIEGFPTGSILAYTVAFGVLLVAGLLLLILGFEVLDSPVVVIVSTIIPLALALGLVWQYLPAWQTPYLVFVILGFLAILVTRAVRLQNKLPTLVLALVHGVAGLTIFVLPIWLAVSGAINPAFALVGIGGALIGIGGLMLSFLKAGKPILSREMILKILPGLLLVMTLLFVAGFRFGLS